MESLLPSTGAALVKPLEFGFKNQKAATIKGSKVLLSYCSTICIIFSCPTNVFIPSSDLVQH
jgi:DsbC/DsbD-like thiol-disulfide interchange protein